MPVPNVDCLDDSHCDNDDPGGDIEIEPKMRKIEGSVCG